MTLMLSDKDVRDLADMNVVVDQLEHGLRAEWGSGAVLPERMNLAHGDTLLRVMPAILPGAGVLGLKFFHGRMADGIRYSVIVSDLASGEVLACVDAAFLTALRTGATSGVATRHLAREDARSVGLVGSGLEAETNLAGVCAVRPIDFVKVYSRNETRREAFAERMAQRFGIDVRAVESPEEAVAGTDVVVAATNTGPSGTIALRGEWLEPGQHVVSIGSTTVTLREVDEVVFTRSDVVVLDTSHRHMQHESGDIAALLGAQPDWQPTALLGDVLTGQGMRTDDHQLTLFKSVGTAAQDLVSAHAMYRLACDRGLGLLVPDISEPKTF